MARNRDRAIKELMPDKDASIKEWQYFRSIMEFEQILNRNITVAEIAEKINVNKFTIRNYAYSPHGTRKSIPPLPIMKDLWEEFGYNFFYVITGEMQTGTEKDLSILVNKYRKESEEKTKEIERLKAIISYLEGNKEKDSV